MASQLPAFPRFVFTIFEPISLLAGALPALFAPAWFVREQLAASAPALSDHSRLVAQQLGNAYGLLFLVGVAVLYTTSETKVVRRYLVALLVADVSHVGLTMLAMRGNLSIGGWNAMTWGNIGVTTFLGLTRTAYLLGWLGPDKPDNETKTR